MNQTLGVVLTWMLVSLGPSALATPLTLSANSSGSLTHTEGCLPVGCIFQSYSSTNPLDDLSQSFSISFPGGRPATSSTNEDGYVIFDLTALTDTVVGAKLEVNLDYTSGNDSQLRVKTIDNATRDSLASNPPGMQSATLDIFSPTPDPLFDRLFAQYRGISLGTEVGTLMATGPFSGLFEISLSDTAVNLINTADGLIALGLDWFSRGASGTLISGDSIAFVSTPRLILETNRSTVPLPATLWLGIIALLIVMRQVRRNQSHVN